MFSEGGRGGEVGPVLNQALGWKKRELRTNPFNAIGEKEKKRGPLALIPAGDGEEGEEDDETAILVTKIKEKKIQTLLSRSCKLIRKKKKERTPCIPSGEGGERRLARHDHAVKGGEGRGEIVGCVEGRRR